MSTPEAEAKSVAVQAGFRTVRGTRKRAPEFEVVKCVFIDII